MATAFPRTLGQQQEPQFVDPYAAQAEAMRQRLAQPLAAMYTPEQIQQRRDENQRQYALGLLGQLTGDDQLGNVGASVFKQALAARQPKITERGSSDQITGQFNYDPDYLRQRDEQQLAGIEQRSAQAQQQWQAQRAAAADRAEMMRQRADDQRALRQTLAGANEPLVQVQDADGNVTYVRRSQAVGQKAPPKGGGAGQPSEGERNAAGFAGIMQQATRVLDAMEAQGRGTNTTQALASVPLIGSTLQRAAMTPQQQQYAQAAQAWVRAKLRKESGASIGQHEMDGEIATFFPQPGDSQQVREQKRNARFLADRAMAISAGRAPIADVTQTAPPLAAPGARPAAAAPATGAGAVPAGVPPDVWQHMTPQERALWPKP